MSLLAGVAAALSLAALFAGGASYLHGVIKQEQLELAAIQSETYKGAAKFFSAQEALNERWGYSSPAASKNRTDFDIYMDSRNDAYNDAANKQHQHRQLKQRLSTASERTWKLGVPWGLAALLPPPDEYWPPVSRPL